MRADQHQSFEYEPLDLSTFCNAGESLYRYYRGRSGGTYLNKRDVPPPSGEQHFHGIPFLVGSSAPNPERLCLAFGAAEGLYQQAVTLPVDRSASYLIFAHALLSTELWTGAPLARVVATITVHFAGGLTMELPIRERFEVGHVPVPWGQYPFLAVPDEKDELYDRYAGKWEEAGFRQMEVGWAAPRGFFLWAWQNPHPEVPITEITVRGGEECYVLGGITLSHVDEFPFVRSTRQSVRIDLTDAERAAHPFDLSVQVDRGTATYPQPLPGGAEAMEEQGMPGFGAPPNLLASPAYVEVAANPTATVTVLQGSEEIGKVRWGELQSAGSKSEGPLQLTVVEPGRNWVNVQVVDEATGEQLPCRVAFLSEDGIPFAPHGHHAPIYSNLENWNIDIGGDVKLGQVNYAYIDGKCQGWLPRGKVMVDIARGFEYEPVRKYVEIVPGQTELKLTMRRWVDPGKEGIYSGDTHVHFLSSQGALTEAAAEGLNIVNLLQSQWGHIFTNTEEFSGRRLETPDGKTIVHVSSENRQHILGHLSLLGLKEPVMPWASGGPGEAELGGGLDITLSHWADAARAQGATVVLPHIPTPNGEPAALIATGRVDAVEMLDFLDYEHMEYYRYLNAGYKLPLVGGTDKMSSRTPVGLYRTYTQLESGQEFTYDAWLAALRAGRTYVSGGILLWFQVDGNDPGSTLHVRKGGTVEVAVTARSIFPFHSLQVVQQGRVVAETTSATGAREMRLHEHLRIEGDTWLAARSAGPKYTSLPHHDERGRSVMAHSSPIYVSTGAAYELHDEQTLHYMLTLVDGSRQYIKQLSAQHDPHHTTFHHGEHDHHAYLDRPFLEAHEALHRRLHQLGIKH